MKSREQLENLIEKVGRDRRAYLNEFFKYVPDSVVDEMIYTEILRNEYLVKEGDPARTVFVILEGQVAGIDYHKMGRVYSFMDFTKMYIVGDFELFSDSPEYGVSIRATEKCKLLKVSAKSYLNWVRHDENALFLRLRATLTNWTSERKFDHAYIYMDCKERLKYYLVKYYEKEKKSKSGKLKIEQTQAELAEKVGFNKRSVQRGITYLEKEGLITTDNGKITISQEQYLKLKEYEGEE